MPREARKSRATRDETGAHPLGLEAPPPAVTIAGLVRATLRHRPDRHRGRLTTLHPNSAEQALTWLARLRRHG